MPESAPAQLPSVVFLYCSTRNLGCGHHALFEFLKPCGLQNRDSAYIIPLYGTLSPSLSLDNAYSPQVSSQGTFFSGKLSLMLLSPSGKIRNSLMCLYIKPVLPFSSLNHVLLSITYLGLPMDFERSRCYGLVKIGNDQNKDKSSLQSNIYPNAQWLFSLNVYTFSRQVWEVNGYVIMTSVVNSL